MVLTGKEEVGFERRSCGDVVEEERRSGGAAETGWTGGGDRGGFRE